MQEVAEMQTVIGLVAAGVGHLAGAGVRARAGAPRRHLPAAGGGGARVRLAMAWREADESPVLEAFLEQARAAAPAEGERGRRGPARN